VNSLLRSLGEFIRPDSVRRATIPPLEAGLRPNDAIDEAQLAATDLGQVDDLVVWNGITVIASGSQVVFLDASGGRTTTALAGRVMALAAGTRFLYAAVEGVGLISLGAGGSSPAVVVGSVDLHTNVTALLELAENDVLAAVGARSGESWQRALLMNDRSGAVLRITDGAITTIVEGVAWPAGLAVDGDQLLVSVSLRHRVERRDLGNPSKVRGHLTDHLPGYPGRIAASADGGWWVAVPFMRNRAVELLLTERALVQDMVTNLAPESWLVPRLSADLTYVAPVQVGQVRVMGVIKPWAPPLSYGLALRVDGIGHIVESVHSRAAGVRHGITGVAQTADGLLVVSAAQGALLRVEGSSA
jgi:hypothetical protein